MVSASCAAWTSAPHLHSEQAVRAWGRRRNGQQHRCASVALSTGNRRRSGWCGRAGLARLAFYRLFAGVDRNLAIQVVIFGVVMPALMYFVGVACDLGALMIARGANFLLAFDEPQRNALGLLFLRLRDHQNTAAEILWGVWLIPLAILVYRSRFVPRFLGVWLFINGIAYVNLSLTGVLWPQYQDKVFTFSSPPCSRRSR